MTYSNSFDVNKNYTSVRLNFGQKPLSSEHNEIQSIQHNEIFQAMDVLLDLGFIYEGCKLLSGSTSSLTLSPGTIHMDGYGRKFSSTTFDLTSILTDDVDIWASITYLNITKTDDPDITHPLQPDLPVGDRSKAVYALTTVDPDTQTNPLNFISRVKAKVLKYNKTSGILTKVVTNAGKFLNLQNIPGQIIVDQVAPGTIDVSTLNITVEGQSLNDALAQRMDDANGAFLAKGGSVKLEDNIISGPLQGIRLRVEALRAYLLGYSIKKDSDQQIYLDHTTDTKSRSNESKTFTTGTLIYNLSRRPAGALTALDGDVTVTNQNINRSLTSNFDNIPAQFTPVVSLTTITQGINTYTQGTDYELDSDQVHWISGFRPAGGTTYQVTFIYRRAFVIPTDVNLGANKRTIVFTGTVLPNNASSFQASYTYYLPRIDSIALNRDGQLEVYKGTPDEFPIRPILPENRFELARVSLPPGTILGNTFLLANGYDAPDGDNIDYKKVQIIASKMRDHQRRKEDLDNLAFNDAANTALNYFVTKDPSLTKKGTFADGFYDDRLSDYGDPTQNMIFNSEDQQGEPSRISVTNNLHPTTTVPSTAKLHNGEFLTLNYGEELYVEQTKWSGEINLDPFLKSDTPRTLDCPNRNLTYGQTFTVDGYSWNFGEQNIIFSINGVKLTGMTVLEGTPGGIADSVTPSSNGTFSVSFVAPDTLPVGYRQILAESQVTGNAATFLLGVQSAATPLPLATIPVNPAPVPTPANPAPAGPCGQLRNVSGHGKGARPDLLILKRPSGKEFKGETQRFNCTTNKWEFVAKFDPIAQTFIADQDMYITGVDLWFTSKDEEQPINVSILQTISNEPDTDSGRLGLATVDAADINTDGTPTRITFSNPVWVQQGQTYAIYLETPVFSYRVQYAQLGAIDRSAYSVTPEGYRLIESQTNSPQGPLIDVVDAQKRDRDSLHRFISKSMDFTVTAPSNLYTINAQVYLGPDVATNSNALAEWVLTDITTNTVLFTYSSFIITAEKNGYFCVKGQRDKYADVKLGNDVIPAPIGLVPGRTYRLTVGANQGHTGYKFLRDDYPADGVLNGSVTVFTTATQNFNVITDNTLLNGLLWTSSDQVVWTANQDKDLRIRIYRANFQANPDATINFKAFVPSVSNANLQELISDTFTHFTSLINAIQPKDTLISMEYSVDGGVNYQPHTPVVFKQREFDNDDDRETWSFFNFGFFSQPRFQQQQIDLQFVPSNPNKAVSVGALTNDLPATQLNLRVKLHTDNNLLTPILDAKNWAVKFEKYGLQTTYLSRTTELDSDATEVKVYVWSSLPPVVNQTVALTLDGDNTINPVYITKVTPDEVRVVDPANGIVEYMYDFTSGDISGQTDFRHPKVKITFDTTDRYAIFTLHRVAINSL